MSKAEGPFALAALGVVPGILAYVGVPLGINDAPVWFGLPLTISVLLGTVGTYFLATKYTDAAGLTWYGRFGETVGGLFSWTWMYTICVALAGYGAFFHFPGIGDHRVPAGSPQHTWILTKECKDGPGFEELCQLPDVCSKTRAGVDADWSKKMCDENEDLDCGGAMGTSAFDSMMIQCSGTCGCDEDRDIFNFRWQTKEEEDLFPCEAAGLCPTRRLKTAMTWNYGAHPRWVEVHVVIGMIEILLVPFQFLKSWRSWNEKAFHRANGRTVVLLHIPGSLSALVLAFYGILDPTLGMHWYTTVFRVNLIILFVLSAVFLSLGVYHIRQKNVEKHAHFMMRAMGMWMVVPFFRVLVPFFQTFVSFRVAFIPAVMTAWIFPLIATELYIALSERFVVPAWEGETVKSDAATDEKSTARPEAAELTAQTSATI